MDPLTAKYPELTPYQFASNTPVQAVDLDGMEGAQPSDATLYLKNSGNLEVRAAVVINIQVLNISSQANSNLKLDEFKDGLSSMLRDKLSSEGTTSLATPLTIVNHKAVDGTYTTKQISFNITPIVNVRVV